MDDKNPTLRLVIGDSNELAADNGEYLYSRIRELYPEIQMIFLISKKSRDYKRLKEAGFNVCAIEDRCLLPIMNKADFILYSKGISGLMPRNRNKTIFLGHGISSKIYDDGFYFRGNVNRQAKYVLCATKWEKDILDNYSVGRFETIMLGFPRHDVLLQKYRNLDLKTKPRQIFITFHWRVGGNVGTSELNFSKSQYLKDINALLNDQRLKELVDNGTKVCFLPHARHMKFKKFFKVPNYIEVPTGKPFQDILVECDVIVTDFSSNSFEMAYMNKPAIIYVPGINEVKNSCKRYHLENLNYPHMTYCKNKEEVVDNIKKIVENETPMKEDVASKVFDRVDTDNTKRLVEWMFEQKKKQLNQKRNNIPTIGTTRKEPKGENTIYKFLKFAYG